MDKSIKLLEMVVTLTILIVSYGAAYLYEMSQGGGVWFKLFPLIYLPAILLKEFIMKKLYNEKYKELSKDI